MHFQFSIVYLCSTLLILLTSCQSDNGVELVGVKESFYAFTRPVVAEYISVGSELYGWEIEDTDNVIDRFAKQLAGCTIDALTESRKPDVDLLLSLFGSNASEKEVSEFLEDPDTEGRRKTQKLYVDAYQSCFSQVAVKNGWTME